MHVPDLNSNIVAVPFVVDTGAARSCIHAFDAMGAFGVPPASLDSRRWTDGIRVGGVGGGILARELAADFHFNHDDGQIESLTDLSVLVGDSTTQGLPSILGMDILKLFELRVTASTVTLERQDS